MRTHNIALLPGDGIGPEVIDAAMLVLEAAAARFDFALKTQRYDWSCQTYLDTGRMMPADGIERLQTHDCILLGAVGWPAKVADSVSLHGLLLPIRKQFDLYVNMRPHRLLAGVDGPLRAKDFDILCIRENTEGEYSGAGGRVHQGTKAEVAVETAIFTRHGVERILRYAFEKARQRSGRLASVSKSNAQKHSMVFWDEVAEEVAADFPDVRMTRYHVDALAARMVTHPETLDVVVASNLFGDILTDLGAAIQGGLGFAASANLNPAGGGPSMFEPVHGSAPDIAGRGLANPAASIWAGAMMLEHLGEVAAAEGVIAALEATTAAGQTVTPDCGGEASTWEMAEAVAQAIR
ncbi:tartrate dehydrogenase [Consotaella salsifontis]|uniref:D-malate dehydrogenase [decarboxylating] n=1 Tax=Consotaella salsifontis TaxID=1365950 RepID=A0A1T4SFI1_9HYPH|nr:tartrate dehydrogenase [Consotaella salsifontis]SKA26935.1 tartrate dehydrogenase/decarboxylase / D-malate dehydrogenase [Consotaella salsifontis]